MRAHRTEVHFHALHGLDDGPETIDESLALLGLAQLEGTATIVVTPHVRGDFVTDVRDLPERTRELSEAARRDGLSVELRTGAELGHDMVGRLVQSELELVAQGPPGARWVLVEAPWGCFGEDFHAATDELRDRGFGVLIGHPERSADASLYRSEGLRHQLRAGSRAQVNAQSITGSHGREAQRAAHALIGEGLVSVVSSDAHGPTRPPLLGEAGARLLERGVDPAICRRLTVTGPRALLASGIPCERRRRLVVA